MLSHREVVERSCINKSRQPDEPTARAVAMHLLSSGVSVAKRAWVYPCRECRGWHITTTANGNHLRASVSASDPYVPPRFQG